MEWKIERRKLSQLKENDQNPRKMSVNDADHLQKSIQQFGLCQPIVCNTDNEIIGGHQRARILKKLGHKEVDVYVPLSTLSPEEVKKLGIRLNKNQGQFDYDILANLWEPIDLLELGFSYEELQIESIPETEPIEDKSKPEKCTMTISFLDPEHLQEAENKIATIVDAYPGATYKVKVK